MAHDDYNIEYVYKLIAYVMLCVKMLPMFKRLILFIFIFSFSNQAFSVGFGHAKLSSHLAEPLHIEVPLLLSDGENIGQINVSLASQQVYKSLKQVLPKSYSYIRVDIKNTSSKTPVVVISSQHAIYDPIVVLVLQAKRGRGIFYKSMQFFLDAADIQTTRQRIKKNSSTSAIENKISYRTSSPNNTILSDGWSRRSQYGPVKDGDNLSEISYRLRKDKRWSNHEIILALYDKNPDAFKQTNINRLKKGSYLDVPNDAQVQAFVSSQRYQALQAKLSIKKRKPMVKKNTPTAEPVLEQVVQQKMAFRGRISLGLDENILPSVADSAMLKRLAQLEPMYKQAMATHLRMDMVMDDKLDVLTQEVRQLHDKIDILALEGDKKINANTAYGWLAFILLVILNIVLFVVYFYRKEILVWKYKFMDMQKQLTHSNTANKNEIYTPTSPEELKQKDDTVMLSKPDKADSSLKINTPSAEWDNLNKNTERKMEDSELGLDLMFKGEDTVIFPIQKETLKPINHTILFEDFMQKKQWENAGKQFDLMSTQEREPQRIQALLVQKMHGEGDIMSRNTTLLRLSRLYKYSHQWHRFCSYFDNDVWNDLQGEKVISFTGKIIKEEIDRQNRTLAETISVKK